MSDDKDAELADLDDLASELHLMTKERDFWKARALEYLNKLRTRSDENTELYFAWELAINEAKIGLEEAVFWSGVEAERKVKRRDLIDKAKVCRAEAIEEFWAPWRDLYRTHLESGDQRGAVSKVHSRMEKAKAQHPETGRIPSLKTVRRNLLNG